MFRSKKNFIGFAVILALLGLMGLASYINTQHYIKSNDWVMHTHQVIEGLENILSTLKDAETGQRGYILTGKETYLDPYNRSLIAIESQFDELKDLTKDNPFQQNAQRELRALVDSMLHELKQTIVLRRQSGLDAAMPIILENSGKKSMDEIRGVVARMQTHEQELLRIRQNDSATSARWTIWTVAWGIPLSLLILTAAAFLVTRGNRSNDVLAEPPVAGTRWDRIAGRYLFALLIVIVASLLRVWLLKLGPMPLFITFYPAVLLVAVVSGGRPGIAATLLSSLVAVYFFVPPYGSLSIESPADVVAVAVFLASNLCLSMVADRIHRTRWAEAFGLAKQQEAEELAAKNEELAQQSEELSQQSEELAEQNEELQSQSEEIHSLNAELTGREEMLRKLLEAARFSSSEASVLRDICAAAKEIFGLSASAVVICERKSETLFIRAQAGLSETLRSWPAENAFPGVVMEEGRTACLKDASLRPDLKLIQATEIERFQAALSSPLRVHGKIFGAVTIYSFSRQEWTQEQFSLVEWIASQCGRVLETLRLQDQLRETAEQNRLLSDLLDHSEQPFGIGYPDGRLGYINEAFERLTGYSREELTSLDWINVLTPSQWQAIEKVKLQELQETGEPVRYEKEYVRKDGARAPIELLVHMIKDNQGEPQYFYSFITDISLRKRSEETLRRQADMLRLSYDAIIVWQLDGSIESWNIGAEKLYGYSIDEAVGRVTHELLSTVFPKSWGDVRAALVAKGFWEGELRHQTRSGREIIVSARKQLIRNEDGVLRVLEVNRDITARKQAEEELRKVNASLEQKVQEKTKELAERATQLRALAGELAYSEQRERKRLAKILHDHLQQMLVGAKFRVAMLSKGGDDLLRQASKEVEGLLDESIAVSRDLTAELSPPILHEGGLRAGLEWLVRRMADKHGLFVDLETEEDGSIPEQMRFLLFDSVRELLFNVVKHARTSSAAVSVRRVNAHLQVTVSDQGVGFDPAAMTNAGEEGAGFGLFSIRERLELLGGDLKIQSAIDQGSRFIISMPNAPAEIIEPASHQKFTLLEPPLMSQSGLESGPKIRILLADDHAVVRQGIGNMLTNEPDMEVVGSAADGQEAVELTARLLPDVILMDMSMPKLNGVEATRIIHSEYPEISIIGLSMFEEAERAQAMRDAGAVQYVMKSGAADLLLSAIRKYRRSPS